MKKNKVLYYVCKSVNWTNWLITYAVCYMLEKMLGLAGEGMSGYGMAVISGNVLFAIFWFLYSSSRSRLLYQMWFFLGYGLAEVLLFANVKNSVFGFIDGNIASKIILTIVCVVMMASRIYTMICETEEYRAGSDRRYNNRLDDEVNKATYKLEYAYTNDEKNRALAEIERAKLRREKYRI